MKRDQARYIALDRALTTDSKKRDFRQLGALDRARSRSSALYFDVKKARSIAPDRALFRRNYLGRPRCAYITFYF
jgi:hypothetical protein